MKGRITATVWKWAGINAAALMAVLLLAYGAGSSSGGLGLRDFGALPQSAGFQLLGALFLVVAVTVALVILLGSRVLKPVQQLAEFSERVAQGDFSTPVEIHSEDDFALIAENCNRIGAAADAGPQPVRIDGRGHGDRPRRPVRARQCGRRRFRWSRRIAQSHAGKSRAHGG